MELSTDINNSLTEYIINKLKKQNISTVIDFVKNDPYKLQQITNLEPDEINGIKDDFLYLLTPFAGFGYSSQVIRTGVER